MAELLLLMLMAGYAFVLGQSVLRLFRLDFATTAGWIAACTALGLGITSYAILCLGLAGELTRLSVLGTGVVLLAVAAIGSRLVVRGEQGVHRWSGSSRLAWPILCRNSLHIILLTTIALGTLTCAMAPPTAGDALCYHLEIPKRFVQSHTIQYLPLTDNSLFPFNMEMLYTLALLLGTPVLAQLLHWLVGMLFGLAVLELGTPILGRTSARWSATIALLVPGVTNQMTAPLNDLAVALFSTLMLVAWCRWCAGAAWRWLILAAVWGGFAIGTKLVATAIVGIVVVATAIVCLRPVNRQRWVSSLRASQGAEPPGYFGNSIAFALRHVSVFVLIVCLTGGIWYVRSWYYLGNPAYPYFNSIFGLKAHTPSLLITARNPVMLPWLATMHPESFGGRGVQFGAIFLAVLPGLALVRCHPHMRSLLGIAAGFGAIWFAVRQDLRFLLPVVGVLSVAVVVVMRGLRRSNPIAFRVSLMCVGCLLLFESMIVLKRARPCLAVAWGGEAREAFLDRHEPSYAVARFANTCLPPDSHLISQDYRGLYFEPDFVREDALRRYLPYEEREDELVARLAGWGFTHVLLVESYNPETAVYDTGFADRLGSAVARLTLVHASHFEGPGGDRRDYRLYQLPGSREMRESNPATARRVQIERF